MLKTYQYQLDGTLVDNPKSNYPVPLGDEKLINRVHYQLESPDAEISLLNGEETIRISEASWSGKGRVSVSSPGQNPINPTIA